MGPDTSTTDQAIAEIRESPLVVMAQLFFSCGIYEIWRRCNVLQLTPMALVRRKGVVHRTFRSIPLDRVQDISVNNTLWWATLVVTSAGGDMGVEALQHLRTRTARNFVSQFMNARERNVPGQTPSGVQGDAP